MFRKFGQLISNKKSSGSNISIGDNPNTFYSKLYSDIKANMQTPGFSASGYAHDEICKYLQKPACNCNELVMIILNKCTMNKDDKVAQKIKGALNDLINPKFKENLTKEGKLGTQARSESLLENLNNAMIAVSSTPYRNDTNKPYRVGIVGDDGVGKNSIMSSFVNMKFPESENDRLPRVIQNKKIMVDDAEMILALDIATLNSKFSEFFGVVIVFDVTNAESYESLKVWIEMIDSHCHDRVYKIIVANKIDQEGKRAITKSDAESFAKSNNSDYIECSAITNQNISELFRTLGSNMRMIRYPDVGAQQIASHENSNMRKGPGRN